MKDCLKISIIVIGLLGSITAQAKTPINTYHFMVVEKDKEPRGFSYTKKMTVVDIGKVLGWSCKGSVEVSAKEHLLSVVCGKKPDLVISVSRCENKIGSTNTSSLEFFNPKTQGLHKVVAQCNVENPI